MDMEKYFGMPRNYIEESEREKRKRYRESDEGRVSGFPPCPWSNTLFKRDIDREID